MPKDIGKSIKNKENACKNIANMVKYKWIGSKQGMADSS